MKVLSVNKFYYIRGGAETYFFNLNKLLEENNIEVIPFSMKDNRNFNTTYEKYFINNIEYSNMNFKNKVKNAIKIIYSFESKNKIKKLINDTHPDIAHLHIFQHQLSPSIIHELKNHNIKIINTIHDLKIICPNYKMLNNDGVCEECNGKKYYNCIKHNCVKNSKANSIVSTVEAYFNEFIKSYSYVDKFICPSKFYMEKFIEFKVPREKVIYLPNFIDAKNIEPNYNYGDYFIYLGRISEEKGIKTLIEAMQNVKSSRLYIVGTGPLEENLKTYAKSLNIENIEFLGFRSGSELQSLISNSRFIVVPSEWYENCPMTIIESMAYGKAVLGSDSGGIPELIRNKETGLIFKTGNKEDLAEKINYFVEHPEETKYMGINARVVAEKEYDKKLHMERIKEIYTEVLNNGK